MNRSKTKQTPKNQNPHSPSLPAISELDNETAVALYPFLRIKKPAPFDRKDPKQVEDAISFFFLKRKEYGEPITLKGLWLYLGIHSDTALEWTNDSNHVLSATLKKAREAYEEDLLKDARRNQIGAIFLLKCTCGYRETDQGILEPGKAQVNLFIGDLQRVLGQAKTVPALAERPKSDTQSGGHTTIKQKAE